MRADGASYNWERQPSGAIGVNTNTLIIINLQPENAGSYRCVASNDCGENCSSYATGRVNGEVVICTVIMHILLNSKESYANYNTTIITKC